MERFSRYLVLLIIIISISCTACSPTGDGESQPTKIATDIFPEVTTEVQNEEETEVVDTPTPENKFLFEDDFSSSTSPYDYKDSDMEIQQVDGILSLSINKPDWISYTVVPGYEYEDTTISFDVSSIAGDPEDGYGLFCRATEKSAYMFEVTYDGFFSVWLWEQQDGYTPLMDYTRSSAIDTGIDKTNNISVTCSGNQLMLSVNDRILANLTDDTISQGDIQLFARNDMYSIVQIHIDNLEIEKPDAILASPSEESSPQSSCMTPGSVSEQDADNLIEVCGEITNWGNVPCPNCALGGYSYLTLDRSFTIISYEWLFNNEWIGDCIRVSDTVEMLGNDPVFVYGKGEGYAGSDCTTGVNGQMTCSQGDYFGYYSGCK